MLFYPEKDHLDKKYGYRNYMGYFYDFAISLLRASLFMISHTLHRTGHVMVIYSYASQSVYFLPLYHSHFFHGVMLWALPKALWALPEWLRAPYST